MWGCLKEPIDKNNFTEQQLKFNKIASWAAVISAFAALIGILIGGFGIYLGWKSIKLTENIESFKVRPHISTNWNFQDDAKALLRVTNHGPGTALIKSIKIWRDDIDTAIDLVFTGNPEQQKLGNKAFTAFIGEELASQLITPDQYFVWLFDGDTPLSIGESRSILYKSNTAEIPKSTQKMVQDSLEAFIADPDSGYEIKFCSVDGSFCSSEGND